MSPNTTITSIGAFCPPVSSESIWSYAKTKSIIHFKRRISHRFDTPLAILQVEADQDDYSHKLIMVWVLVEEKPWSPNYMTYNSEFRVRGQPRRKLQAIRVSARLTKVLLLSSITIPRYPLEAFVPRHRVSQYGPIQKRSPYSTSTLNF